MNAPLRAPWPPTPADAVHIADALRRYRDGMRTAGLAVPPSLALYEADMLTTAAIGGQPRPVFDDQPQRQERGPVLELLTLAETSALTGYSTRTLRRRAAAGELPTVGCGRGLRIRRADLDTYLRSAPCR